MIAGKGLGYFFVLHNDERNAIGERPGLIESSPIQLDALLKQSIGAGFNSYLLIAL